MMTSREPRCFMELGKDLVSEDFHNFGIFSGSQEGRKEEKEKGEWVKRKKEKEVKYCRDAESRNFHYKHSIHTPDKPGKLKQYGEYIVLL